MALHPDLEPQHAHVGAHQHVLLGFRDDHGIGAVAAQQRRQGAVAGAFLFDHRLEIDGGPRGIARRAHGIVGVQIGNQPGLHVGRAATVHPAVDDGRVPRRAAPHVDRSGRHHVDVSVQDERAAGLLFGTIGAHHVEGVFVRHGHRAEAGMRLDVAHVDLPAVHGEAARAHRFEQEVLRRVFLFAQRRKAHQILGEGELGVEPGIDGLQDAAGLFFGKRRRGGGLLRHRVSLGRRIQVQAAGACAARGVSSASRRLWPARAQIDTSVIADRVE